MAQFNESKVINALHPEKAEVGKKYWYADSLISLKRYVEENNTDYMGELIKVEDTAYEFPFDLNGTWQFLYPYEEPQKQRMTNIQLMEWLAKGNGLFKHNKGSVACYDYGEGVEEELNDEVDESYLICPFGQTEWVEPTVILSYKDGLAEGRKEKCLEQNKDGTIRPCEVMNENEELKKDKEWLDNSNNEQTEVILKLYEQIEQLSNDNHVLKTAFITQQEQIEKMKNIIYEEVDFCSYCPHEDCKNDEGVCPCANISKEEQEEILIEWITKNGS